MGTVLARAFRESIYCIGCIPENPSEIYDDNSFLIQK